MNRCPHCGAGGDQPCRSTCDGGYPAFHFMDADPGEFSLNEHGVWCPSCGEIIEAPWNIDEDWEAPSECRTCGFPDDAEKMAEHFL